MSILIKNVLLHRQVVDVYIKDNRFEKIAPGLDMEADQVIDGTDKAIMPSFANGHTHAAMTLLRGYAEDMELHTWLNNHIWPLESKLTQEDVYVGSKLACLEMIKSGTTFFNDMYWHFSSTARAVEEMGIRAALSSVFIDFNDPDTAEYRWKECLELFEQSRDLDPRIDFALGPHSIYAVSRDSLLRVQDFAAKHDLQIHIHLCETEKEVQDSLEQHGQTPVQYLHSLGLLGPNLCACHAIWLNQEDMDLMAANKVKVIYNPVSNLKLCSGNFPYQELKKRGVRIALGTDGCSSNNNLDMLEEMKFAALTNKAHCQDPAIMPASEVFSATTSTAANIFGLDCGEIAEGKLADCILINLNHPQVVPNYNLVSNLVYSANGGCVDTTICNGKILMQNREVPGEEEIISQARETARRLVSTN
ncbi:MAG: amidohydrolase [Thermodesulfobacteriota bacterium]